MKEKIVIENTLYSLLLYWLIKEVNNTTYILDASKIDNAIINNLKQKNNVFLFYPFYSKLSF